MSDDIFPVNDPAPHDMNDEGGDHESSDGELINEAEWQNSHLNMEMPLVPRIRSPTANSPEMKYDVADAIIDFEYYSSNFKSYALMQRLFFIAHHSSTYKAEALTQLISYICENTLDVGMYHTVAETFEVELDRDWAEATVKKAKSKLDNLECALKSYRTNSITDIIRRGYEDLAEHHIDAGELSEATRAFSKARDYCNTIASQIQMYLNVVRVSIYVLNWSLVLSYVKRALVAIDGKLAEKRDDTDGRSRREHKQFLLPARATANVALGLYELQSRRYAQAAQAFVSIEYENLRCPELVSHREVGVYAALCALATYDRIQLAQTIINNTDFKRFLELEPKILQAAKLFSAGAYEKCFHMLDAAKPGLMLDMNLARHLPVLMDMIRKRGMVAFVTPFARVDLRRMAAAFNTDLTHLEDELLLLILQNKIQAQIDSVNGHLVAKTQNKQTDAIRTVEQVTQLTQQYAYFVAARSALIRGKIVLKQPKRIAQSDSTLIEKSGGNKAKKERKKTSPAPTVPEDARHKSTQPTSSSSDMIVETAVEAYPDLVAEPTQPTESTSIAPEGNTDDDVLPPEPNSSQLSPVMGQSAPSPPQ